MKNAPLHVDSRDEDWSGSRTGVEGEEDHNDECTTATTATMLLRFTEEL